jgi:geranylgeranyl reductase family protein
MKYDVVIVGAGPAGSTAAKFLSEKGIKVLLLDKSKFPRDKSCGGGIPVRVLKKFKFIEEKDLIESYIYGGCVYSPSQKYKVKLQKNEPLSAMVLRKKFDYGLVKIAIDAGTTFIDGKCAAGIQIFPDKAKISFTDKTSIESEIVIGADGVWSAVAKQSGLSQNCKNIGMSIVCEYAMSPKMLDYYFTEKRIAYIHLNIGGIKGYGWVFPKKKHVNLGICEFESINTKRNNKLNFKKVYESYVQILKENKVIPNNLKIGKIKGAALPIRPLEKTYADRVILCGDAAGLINPSTGAGIDYAMTSGKIAANVIADALEAGVTTEKFLSKYQKIWKKDFGSDIQTLLRVQKRWGEKNEEVIKLASRDKKISELAYGFITGNLRIYECRLKIVRLLLYLYFQNLFHRT